MSIFKRLRNLLKYGHGPEARERKREDKRRAKLERFHAGDWRQEEGFARRRYESYADYLAHQSSKLDGIIDRLRETQPAEYEEFLERFKSCEALANARNVLTLGARLGTEVRALQALGHFAVGIDLNPGPDNSWVLPGDFHALVFPDASSDAVYTNALDHAFDLERVIGEVRRVLRPGGCFVAELDEGYGEGGLPGDFEAIHWKDAETLVGRIAEIGGFEVESVRSLGRTRRGLRKLVVFRKPG